MILVDKLWDIDPGYLRLQQAFKTVMAIVISQLIMFHHGLDVRLMAAIAAGMSLQGIKASNFKRKLALLLLFDSAYLLIFTLGLLFKGQNEITSLLFVLLAFFCFYIRRFGSEYNFPGLMLWLFFFMANVLPFAISSNRLSHIYGFVIGLLVGALVYLFVYPNKQRALFVKSYNTFFNRYHQGIVLLKKTLSNEISYQRYCNYYQLHKVKLFKTVDFNKAIVESKYFLDSYGEVFDLSLIQYGLAKDLTIMCEAYETMMQSDVTMPKSLRNYLISEMDKLNRYFIGLTLIYACPLKLSCKDDLQSLNYDSAELTDYLDNNNYNQLFMPLFNFNLGLKLTQQNLLHLREIADDKR